MDSNKTKTVCFAFPSSALKLTSSALPVAYEIITKIYDNKCCEVGSGEINEFAGDLGSAAHMSTDASETVSTGPGLTDHLADTTSSTRQAADQRTGADSGPATGSNWQPGRTRHHLEPRTSLKESATTTTPAAAATTVASNQVCLQL